MNALLVPAIWFTIATLLSGWMYIIANRINNYSRTTRLQLRILTIVFVVSNAFWAGICWNI